MNCRRNTENTFPTDAGFLCEKALVRAAVLIAEISETFCTSSVNRQIRGIKRKK
jgi:hypothetical protein